MSIHRLLLLILAVTLCCGVASDGRAAVHEQMAVHVRSMAMGNAVTAYPPGTLAVHYNPAGLTNLKGTHLETGLAYANLELTDRFTAPANYKGFFGETNDHVIGTEATTRSGAMYIPFHGPTSNLMGGYMGMSYRKPGSRWALGYGFYAPYGVGLEFPSGPAVYGAQFGYNERLVYAGPGAAYRLTDKLSIGASIGLGLGAEGLRIEMRAPNDIVALTGVLGEITKDLEDEITLGIIPMPLFGGGLAPFEGQGTLTADEMVDNFVPSFNLGLLWEPFQWLSLGAVYQSEARGELSGYYRLEYGDRWRRMMDWLVANELLKVISEAFGLPTNGGIPADEGRASTEYVWPRRVQLGVMLRPIENLRLTFDLHWANWSVAEADKFVFDHNLQVLKVAKLLAYEHAPNVLVLERHMRDTWHWSAGMEFQATSWFAFRCGYEDRKSSTNPDYYDMTFSLPDLRIYSVGFGTRLGNLGIDMWNEVELDITGMLIQGDDVSFHQGEKVSSNLNTNELTAIMYNPYSGLNFDQEVSGWAISTGVSINW
ncbi:MAG: OmpP1/FadL family transporter [Desulfatibacillaceae bacterium]